MHRVRVLSKSQALSLGLNQSSAMVLHLLFLVFPLAQADTLGPNYPSLQETTYQPNLAVVVGILGLMFVLTILILAYAKLCHRASEPATANRRAGLLGSSRRFSGIEKAVIESLPFFRFSSLKGSKDGLECAVCLSRFEDVEVLRLLPKCKHAFHIDCIDHWLEKHSTCPLCRDKVSSEDLKLIAYSNSMRFLWNNNNNNNKDHSELREEPNNVEIFVQREDSQRGSSRFSIIGNSFRKFEKEELLIRNDPESDQRAFHKHNHKMVVSGLVFNNRWSDLSSSDLVFLSSEMLNDVSSGRFSSIDAKDEKPTAKKAVEDEEIVKIKEEIEIKKSFENKVGAISTSRISSPVRTFGTTSRSVMSSGEQRSVSEITALSRFYGNSDVRNKIVESSSSSSSEFANSVREERIRKVWLPIAKRTVQWFANRERSRLAQNPQTQSVEV